MPRAAEPGHLDVYQPRKRRKFRIWPVSSVIQIWLTGAGWSELNPRTALDFLAEEPVVTRDELLRWLERRWLDKEA